MTNTTTGRATALRFGVTSGHRRDLRQGEYFYRVELADGREALIAASSVTVENGALIAGTDDFTSLVLAAGTWTSLYMCEALMAYDPWSILNIGEPT